MSIRTLSIIVLVLAGVAIILRGNFGAPFEGPSAELREYFKFGIAAILVAFVGYLAMTRR